MAESLVIVWLLPLVVIVASFVLLGVRRNCPTARGPYTVYIVSYTLTTAIGSLLLLSQEWLDFLGEVNVTANLYVLTVKSVFNFAMMIYSPLIVPGLVILFLASWRKGSSSHSSRLWLRSFVIPVSVPSFIGTAGLLIAYIVLAFYRVGALGILGQVAELSDDYGSLILMRANLFNDLGMVTLAMIYVGMPTLSFVALHRAVLTKARVWFVILAAVVAATLLFQMMTVQKSIAVVFLLAMVIGAYSLGVIRSWIVVVGGGLVIIGMTFVQEIWVSDWSIVDTFILITYRMAVGTVAYLNIFPFAMDYLGIDLMLDVVGYGSSSQASILVFQYVYPDVTGIQGNAPAAAHVMAYAEAGVAYGLAVLVFIGFVIRFIGDLWNAETMSSRGGMVFAVYMQGLVSIYYLTQVSLRDVLASSYGIIWTFVVLTPLLIISTIDMRAKTQAIKG